MRQTIAGLIAGAALVATLGAAAPAQACAVVDPCARGYYGYGHGYGYYGMRERLPDPMVQYYYVNRGPTYTGPGNFAPAPVYQERTVSGWQGYGRPHYHHHHHHHRYTGGPYGNPMGHYYHGAPDVRGPVIYTYRGAHRHHVRRSRFRPHRVTPPKYYYTARPSIRYGYRVNPRMGDMARAGRVPGAYASGHATMHRQGTARMPHHTAPRTIRPGSKPHYHSF
jgi:hypothetical protein